ncbi:MAG: hypothetical protein IPL65_12815 [Lewinellaceae bacterium]|nr:hypothetical protein [Lewinellaceae bacterium]
MKKSHLFLATTLFLLFLQACDERRTAIAPLSPEQQHPYFPLAIGQYAVYQIDSMVYDPISDLAAIVDTSTTYLKEEITDTLRDNTGALLYKVERFERKDANTPWVLKNIWTAQRSTYQAIRTEDNLRFLKLVFPLDRRTDWNGNIWIDDALEIEIAGERIRPFTNWHYEVDTIDMPGIVGAFAFDSLLTITEADDVNLIERRLSRAKYARNVGLVWREQWILDSRYPVMG